jgi:hypothetical protein
MPHAYELEEHKRIERIITIISMRFLAGATLAETAHKTGFSEAGIRGMEARFCESFKIDPRADHGAQ